MATARIDSVFEAIKQYPDLVQVQRRVKVKVPGKHFPGLQPSEQHTSYAAEAVEFCDRHKFERHARA